MEFICKCCNKPFKKKLNLKEKTEQYVPKYCSKECSFNSRIQKEKKITKQRNYKIPKSSKEEKAFGELIKSFFPQLKSQWRLKDYEHHYDFYSPELNLIIEYNGEYWHNKPKNRISDRKHLNEATKNKIHLAVVTDREWKLFVESGLPSRQKLIKLLNHSIKNMLK